MIPTSPPRIGDESKLRLGRTAIVTRSRCRAGGSNPGVLGLLTVPGQQPDRVAGLSGYRRDRKPLPNARAAATRRRATFLHISSPSHQLADFEHEPTERSEAHAPEKHGGGHGDPPSLVEHPGEQRRALSRFARDQKRNFAPIPRQGITACLLRAPTSFGIRPVAEIRN